MTRILIGACADAEPERLSATLASLRAHTPIPHEVVLLLNSDAQAVPARQMPPLPEIRWIIVEPRGGAMCFNRLAQAGEADVVVLLESGALVGPGWLGHLLAALEADPRNGLAGPSTNRGWNEQAVFSRPPSAPGDLAATAAEAARRFGDSVRTLEPLYSLADFCYAVRREVIEAIGLADENYGAGPCWEMDYNIRAARAGWRGVWAGAAFVHRLPFTPARQRDEARLFEASKHRYQDKFCGARLRGEKSNYRNHCRGNACPNFAPMEFQSRWLTAGQEAAPKEIAPPPAPAPTLADSPSLVAPVTPLVSCIMPTCNRRPFIHAAIQNFLKQDYPNLELLIVDDGDDSVADQVPADPRIRYVRLSGRRILGEKRNQACAEARGEIICHWDDDDWYPANRVSRQVAALQSGTAKICGTGRLFYYEPSANRAWLYTYGTAAHPWVAGNTLAYRRSFWQSHPFPNVQVGEDARFVWADMAAGIADLNDPALCVARVHQGNTSRKVIVGTCWQPIPVAEIELRSGSALAHFHAEASPAYHRGTEAVSGPLPLVSCIMPTAGRPAFVRLALRCFQHQDYPRRELIIVHDPGDDLSGLIEGIPEVRLIRAPARLAIGAKRNLACQAARGTIIAHWDDDDWHGPERLSHQVAPLLQGLADLSGVENRYLLELVSGQFWSVTPALHQRMFVGDVHGGTLVFQKSIYDQGLRYPEVNLAEDAGLLRLAIQRGKRLSRLSNPGLFVYVRHGSNAWRFVPGRFLDSAGWQKAEGPTAFLPWLPDYQACLGVGSTHLGRHNP